MPHRARTARPEPLRTTKNYNDLVEKGWIPAKNSTPNNQNRFVSFSQDEKHEDSDSLGEAGGVALGIPTYVAAVAGAGFVAASGAGLAVIVLSAVISGAYGSAFGLLCAQKIKRDYDAQLGE